MSSFICHKCNKELPLNNDYFHRSNKLKTGFVYQCKKCVKYYQTVTHKNELKNYYNNYNRERRKNNEIFKFIQYARNDIRRFIKSKRLNTSYYLPFNSIELKEYLKTI
jgi:hypothetical protein